MESINNYGVKLGFWTNWSHGKILGATMTLTRQHGGFLIAFLAIFVGMAGKSFWRLVCFATYFYLSSAEPQDCLYHQRQAILRNSDTAFDSILRLLVLMSAWLSNFQTRKPISRLLPLIIAALATSAAFGVASIFSSSVTNKTLNEVLLEGSRCGLYMPAKTKDDFKADTIKLPYETERANKFLNYGRQCYVDSSTQGDGCELYTKPRLPLKSNRGIGCPFGDGICKLKDDNLIMDTGRLDSLEHFGINIAPKYRFQLRFVTTCAPLKTQGYTSDYNDTDYGAVKRYWYGPDTNFKETNNFTYQLPENQAYQPKDHTTSGNIPRAEYQLGSKTYFATTAGENWRPIDALKIPDADVYILFMSAPGIYFSTPVTDPWFSAQKPKNRTSIRGNVTTFWEQDEPLGVMACIQQVQYCNPNLPENERCEPLRGIFDPRRAETWAKMFRSKDALDAIYWVDLVWLYNMNFLNQAVFYIGASALRARYSLSSASSGPLPENQWQVEAEHLKKGTLASLQHAFVEVANGIPEALDDFRQPPAANETMAQMMCANQKIVSNAYSSFNVLGVGLILTIGSLIIILDICLGPAVAWWRLRKYTKHQIQQPERGFDTKSSHPLYSTLEWSQTSVLQLQRLAHESAGYGAWSGCDKTVPVTERGELLACLDLGDLKHPLLQGREKSSVLVPEEQVSLLKPESVGKTSSSSRHWMSEVEVEAISHSAEASDEQSGQRDSSPTTRD